MNLKESFASSLKSLFANKMRSFLTMLGIIIGISSVIMITTLGEGGRQGMFKSLNDIANNAITLKMKDDPKLNKKNKDILTSEDAKSIKTYKGISAASLTANGGGYVLNKGQQSYIWARGGDEDYLVASSDKLLRGRNFNKEEVRFGKKVILIDETMSEDLYGTLNSLGKIVEINSYHGEVHQYMIIGVIENKMKKLNKTFGNKQYMPVLPLKTLEKTLGFWDGSANIIVKAEDMTKKEKIETELLNFLGKIKKNTGMYESDKSLSQELGQINNILNIITMFISAVAAISLFVGGIGVMNIMLVSVTERTKEIGIRKAIGAKKKDIMLQFLIEAVILTLIGGALGVLFGYLGSYAIGSFIDIVPILKVNMIIISFSVSTIVGLIFGVFPAKKAASLNPIDALRFE